MNLPAAVADGQQRFCYWLMNESDLVIIIIKMMVNKTFWQSEATSAPLMHFRALMKKLIDKINNSLTLCHW